MRRCEDEKMWRWEGVKMRRRDYEKMWRWEDVTMRRCEDEKVWRWEDEKMWRWEDEKMWRWEDVKMRRCEDEKMWRWEDVKMRRWEDVWRCLKMYITDPPLLDEPFTQTLSGTKTKKHIIYVHDFSILSVLYVYKKLNGDSKRMLDQFIVAWHITHWCHLSGNMNGFIIFIAIFPQSHMYINTHNQTIVTIYPYGILLYVSINTYLPTK